MVFNIPVVLLSAFFGYLLGRFGHCYLNVWLKNPKWAPHHWIYGLILIVVGIFLLPSTQMALPVFSFGLGCFISDFKDFLKLKVFSPDEEGKKSFWNID